MLIGIPGSGKTTFAKSMSADSTRISVDEIKNWDQERIDDMISALDTAKTRHLGRLSRLQTAEIALLHDLLKRGKNVVIDDMNLSTHYRTPYILLARQNNARVHAVYFSNTNAAEKRNLLRKDRTRVPKHLMTLIVKNIDKPTKEEGFEKITINDD